MIAIIDYGMGNIHSVNKALESCQAKTVVTNRAEEILSCQKAVLPGVGAFNDAMAELKKRDLISVINIHIKNKKPLLGICLGLQLFFAGSQEAGATKGLGVLKGKVKRFPKKKGLKVPHMGWNQLRITGEPDNRIAGTCPLLKDIPDNSYVYFCHSYYPQPEEKNVIAATTDYGLDFASVVWQDNLYGVQFHPEKSQDIGLKILSNFVKLC
jgi:glutamine amidotransferase